MTKQVTCKYQCQDCTWNITINNDMNYRDKLILDQSAEKHAYHYKHRIRLEFDNGELKL